MDTVKLIERLENPSDGTMAKRLASPRILEGHEGGYGSIVWVLNIDRTANVGLYG
jgi:hypothetical protein